MATPAAAPCFVNRCASSRVTDRRVPLFSQLRRAFRMEGNVARRCGDANTYTVRVVSAGTDNRNLRSRDR